MVAVNKLAKDYVEPGAFNTLVSLYGFVGADPADPAFLTKGGDLGTVIRVEGIDAECPDHPQIDQVARRFEAALRILDERFRVYQYLFKRDHAAIPHRDYPNSVVQRAIRNRIAYLAGKSEVLYTLEIYFVVLLAHRDALPVYRNTDLNWTYVSPAAFIEPGERTGKFRTGTDRLIVDEAGNSKISAEDFAVAILNEVEHPHFTQRRFTVGY